MIVGPLKNNSQFSVIFLSITCIGLFLASATLVDTSQIGLKSPENILYHIFFYPEPAIWVQNFLSLIIILLGAFLVNFLAINEEITSKKNFLPAFFYVLFAFSTKTSNTIEPILLANIFVLLSIYFLMNSYRQEIALSEFYKAGLFMGLSAFFYIYYIYLFPLCIIAILILRAFYWREWAVMLLGLLTPIYLFLNLSYLINNQLSDELTHLRDSIINIHKPVFSEYYFIQLLAVIFLLFLAFFNYLNKGFGTKVKTQKNKYIVIWMLLLCVWIVFFEESTETLLLPCALPFSILVGDYLSEIKQLKIANTLLVLFIAGFAIVYFHLLGVI